MNKKGVTLTELLAYMTLVSVVLMLFGGLMGYVWNSYDKINGQGALTNEANNIMSLVISKTNAFNPQYVQKCGEIEDTCIELVIKNKREINEELGIIEYVEVNETVKIELRDNNIYINGLLINNQQFGVNTLNAEHQKSILNYSCEEMNSEITGACQRPVIYIKLVIVRVNKEGDSLTKTNEEAVFENRFSY